MIISKKHKYCFVEYPRSASYSIRKELIEHYDGQEWLNKHSRYQDFLDSMPTDYHNYYFFCSIRNPLTDLISIYNINRTNRSGRAKEDFWKDSKWFIRHRELRRARFFIESEDTSFQTFFKKLFKLPYIKPRILAELSNAKYNRIIRVENLQVDFKRVLEDLELEPKGFVRRSNVSTKNEINLNKYYPEELRDRAVKILGPMMQFMGYDFPETWKIKKIPATSKLFFLIMTPLSTFFWNHINYKKRHSKLM
jgi:hypothetical protein